IGKRAFRAKKRSSITSDYHIVDKNRVERLSERLQSKTIEKDSMEVINEKSKEEEEDKNVKKVSTSGPRMSCREVWKASKRGVQLRRAPGTVVWHKRMAGKAQRRR
ncbi:hypothetical protein CROQUDRAFT_51808, partial [Cronartium quercuum f. sp. fusiforme G11]